MGRAIKSGGKHSDGNQMAISKNRQKKSVRLMMQNYKIELHEKAKTNYVWPRTVEAAKDPFQDASGKNKMFFVIACNLFPESKIVQPSDTESEDCASDVEESDDNSNTHLYYKTAVNCHPRSTFLVHNENGADDKKFKPTIHDQRVHVQRRPKEDLSWRSQNNRRTNKCRVGLGRKGRGRGRNRLNDPKIIQDVIDTVVARNKRDFLRHLNPPPRVEKIHYPSQPEERMMDVEQVEEEEFNVGCMYSDLSDDAVSNNEEEINHNKPEDTNRPDDDETTGDEEDSSGDGEEEGDEEDDILSDAVNLEIVNVPNPVRFEDDVCVDRMY